MNRRTYLGAVTATVSGLAGCSGSGTESGSASGALGSADARIETVVTDLEVPWGAAFRDDSLYLTERPGRLVRVQGVVGGEENGNGSGERELVADLTDETRPAGEGGLLGLVFHPDDRSVLYCYQTYRGSDGPRNRVLRGRLAEESGESDQSLAGLEPIVEGIPASSIHNGGRLAIEDRALYVTTGDASDGDLAQNRSSLAGKILRLTLGGEPHPENPFDDPVFSYGHRNPQGLAFEGAALYNTEHGPDHDDEINLLESGGNYGWPIVMGRSERDRFVEPLAAYTPTVAPASAAIYDGPIAEWQGDLFFGALAGDFLGRAELDERAVTGRGRLLKGEFGRLRTAFSGPDEHLYATTSNRDGRGSPTEPDDRVLRIRPE
jgi:glucose/arabinose dehydrogenase